SWVEQKMEKRGTHKGKKTDIARAAVCAFLGTTACLGNGKGSTSWALSNSALSVVLFLALSLLCFYAFRAGPFSKRKWICAGIGALFLGTAWQWGVQLETWGSVSFPAKR